MELFSLFSSFLSPIIHPDDSDSSDSEAYDSSDPPFTYAFERVNIADPNSVKLPTKNITDSIEITGDLHGSVIRRIFDLIQRGFLVISSSLYARLLSDDKQIRYAAFEAICDALCQELNINSEVCKLKKLQCLGDALAERCNSFDDGHLLRLDYICIKNGIPMEFVLGNHDMQFIMWLDQVLNAPDNRTIEEKYRYIHSFHHGQNQSLVNFSQRLIDHFSGKSPDPTLDDWETWATIHLAHSILFSSEMVLLPSCKPALINSKHSRAGIATFMSLADWLNSLSIQYALPYIHYKEEDIFKDSSALPRLSSDVNRAFQALLITKKSEGKQKIRLEGLRAFVTSYNDHRKIHSTSKKQPDLGFKENKNPYPLYSLTWERKHQAPDLLPSTIGKTLSVYFNGHIGDITPEDRRKTEFNADSDFCKEYNFLMDHKYSHMECWVTQSEQNIPETFTGMIIINNDSQNPSFRLYHAKQGIIQKEIQLREHADYDKIKSLFFAEQDFFEGKTLLTKIHLDLLCYFATAESLTFFSNPTILSINSTLNNANLSDKDTDCDISELNLDISDTIITCQYVQSSILKTLEIPLDNPHFDELKRCLNIFQQCMQSLLPYYNLNDIHSIIENSNLDKQQAIIKYNHNYTRCKKDLFDCLLDACTNENGKKAFVELNRETPYCILSIQDCTHLYLEHLTKILRSINTLPLPDHSKIKNDITPIQEHLTWFEDELKKEKPKRANFFAIKEQETLLWHCLNNIKKTLPTTSSNSPSYFEQTPLILLTTWIDNTLQEITDHLERWKQPILSDLSHAEPKPSKNNP